MTDCELVRRMQQGDMQAFDTLYERYKDDAYRLLRTLSRAAWKYCRKARRETPVSEFFDENTGESALSAVLRTEEQRRLYAALRTLDEKRRVAVVLYYFDDRSVKEIAQATGVTEGTVKSRLFSARRHLRQALTAGETEPREAVSHE